MSFLKNMLNGNLKRSPVSDDKTKDKDVDMQPTDLFEGGHKLTALENIGSSLTTLWSSCGLNVISSRENIESQAEQNSKSNNTSNEIAKANNEDTTLASTCKS
ncbi:uncharacterized protein [Drosophila virilis]|uniref:Uncharacterized protein n=1 Tax=Drosophila virilis TaxID=7244 RepID=B4M2D6_DROVI|nr:uncharacterized protein LOC6632184 [Drosophila virilis]EDW65840.2 uncharacterized protein Dvir_GJ19470 [Drosophila virilis]